MATGMIVTHTQWSHLAQELASMKAQTTEYLEGHGVMAHGIVAHASNIIEIGFLCSSHECLSLIGID